MMYHYVDVKDKRKRDHIMSLYAIGDLHLHFQSVLKAKAQLYDPLWKDHEKRFVENCDNLLSDDDVLVLVGDHSWGKNLSECEADFDYIRKLPGRKILTRGNHDMFWDAGKTNRLNETFNPELTFLQDGYEPYKSHQERSPSYQPPSGRNQW